VAKKILKINTKTKRAHNLRGAAATATGHSRAIMLHLPMEISIDQRQHRQIKQGCVLSPASIVPQVNMSLEK